MSTISEFRPSPIAGRWYDSDPERLAQQLDGYLNGVKIPALEGEVIGLVVPHAGYIYSGRTAAYGFKAVQGQRRDLVVVISPLHGFHPALALTSAHQAYLTPLGSQRIDVEAVRAVDESLRRQYDWGLTAVARDQEHSLEIELPFLQRALSGDFKLLPIMLRTQDPREIQQLSQVLTEVLRGRNCLLVASSDLSHFFPEETASLLDGEMLRQIGAFSPQGVLDAEREEKGFACGVAAVATVLWVTRALGAKKVEILHHSTSGDTTGDHSSVVGYGAAAILK